MRFELKSNVASLVKARSGSSVPVIPSRTNRKTQHRTTHYKSRSQMTATIIEQPLLKHNTSHATRSDTYVMKATVCHTTEANPTSTPRPSPQSSTRHGHAMRITNTISTASIMDVPPMLLESKNNAVNPVKLRTGSSVPVNPQRSIKGVWVGKEPI
jgi:hypothetical protein